MKLIKWEKGLARISKFNFRCVTFPSQKNEKKSSHALSLINYVCMDLFSYAGYTVPYHTVPYHIVTCN